MATKRAKTLEEADIASALDFIKAESTAPERDALFVLLSCRLGLRAQEIALIHFRDILDARGALETRTFFVSKRGAKYGRARSLPMHREVAAALAAYIAPLTVRDGPLFHTLYGRPMTSDGVQKQLARVYEKVGLRGCSSHSGRRTFGTRAARKVAEFGGSLKDVMLLMGHADIQTTEIYVEPGARAFDLVNAL